MKKVINKKLYDTEKATEVCDHTCYDNGNWFSCRTLYKTVKGAFFFEVRGDGNNFNAPSDHLEAINEEEAREFCEEYGSAEQYTSQWEAEEA